MPHKLRLYPIRVPNRKALMVEVGWDDEEVRSERRRFTIDTYANFKRDEDCWNKIRPVNEFLLTLDKDEAFYLVRLFVQAKRAIMGVTDRRSLVNAITAIDEIVCKTFVRLDLSKRISDFILADKNMAEPDLSNVGKNKARDTPEKTFFKPEYDQIKTIVVISKILFPIFGEIIDRVTNIDDSSNETKEIMAFGIMNELLRTDFHEITVKLQNYIDGLVGKAMVDDVSTCFRGMTQASLTSDRLAKMIVKSGVNFDLYKEGGNIIMLLVVSLKRSVQNDSSGGGKKKLTYRELCTPEKGEDGRNISSMEHEAHILREPLEVPIVVSISVDYFINDYIEQNGISKAVFDRAVSYYQTTTLPPTIVNEWLIGMFVADPIGSAYCIKYMDIKMFSRLSTLIQIYALRMGFGPIVPLLTMIPTGIRKMSADDVDNSIIARSVLPGIINYYPLLYEQTSHMEKFTSFRFKDFIDSINSFIIEYNHTFNVAPDILAIGDISPSKEVEGEFKYGKDIINELYRFAHHLLTQARPDRKIIE